MSNSSDDQAINGLEKTTRGVLASSEAMFSLSQLVTMFVLAQDGSMHPRQPSQYGQIPLIFYEVSSPTSATGSWWIPTCSTPDMPSDVSIWGDWEPLKTSDDSVIVTQSILRPQNAWCWVPSEVIEENLSPIYFLGRIIGKHPINPPR